MRARLVPRSTSRPASWPWPSATVVGVAGGGGLVGWGTAGAGGGGGGGGRWGRRRPGYHRLQALEPGLLLGRGGRRGRGRGRTGRGRRGGLRCRRGRWRGGGGLDAGRWGRRLIGLAPGGLDARERVGDREGAQLEARLAGGVGDLLLALVDRAAQPLVAVGRLDREVEAAVALLLFKIRVIAGADRRQRHARTRTASPGGWSAARRSGRGRAGVRPGCPRPAAPGTRRVRSASSGWWATCVQRFARPTARGAPGPGRRAGRPRWTGPGS